MAFLDKFNDWYNKAVPDAEPGVQWMEPAEGSRYRWKRNRSSLMLAVAFIFGVALLPLPGKHGEAPAPLLVRMAIGAVLGCLIFVIAWASSFTRTSVVLSKNAVVIGTGRGRTKFSIDNSTSLRLDTVSGHRTIVFARNSGEKIRVFLDPLSESGVLGFLTHVGLLEAAAVQVPSHSPEPAPDAVC